MEFEFVAFMLHFSLHLHMSSKPLFTLILVSTLWYLLMAQVILLLVLHDSTPSGSSLLISDYSLGYLQ